MGQARRKDLSQREVAFSKSDFCIFCGGSVPATTVEHYPPKSIFREKKWPEGYVFPACAPCNSGSREADNWAGFLSMMDPSVEWTQDEAQKSVKRLISLDTQHPGLIKEIFKGSVTEKKTLARRLKIEREKGQTYLDLPIVNIPKKAHDWIAIFAPKLTKALHFQHTKRIPPSCTGLKYWWFTNANALEGKIPQIINKDFGFPDIRRANVDLNKQFSYGYQVSNDGTMGLFVIRFRFSFMIFSVITFDPAVIDRIKDKVHSSVEESEIAPDLPAPSKTG